MSSTQMNPLETVLLSKQGLTSYVMRQIMEMQIGTDTDHDTSLSYINQHIFNKHIIG